MQVPFRLTGFKLTIFSRLVLGNIAVLAMATAVSVYAILQLGHMKDISRRIIQVHNVLIDLNKDMTGALLSETRYEKKFALLQDETLHDGFLASRAEFEKYLNEALTLADSPEVKESLNRVRELNGAYAGLFEKDLASAEAGRRPSKRHNREKERLVNEAMAELGRLKASSQQSILRKINELDRTGTRARTVAQVITGIALLFGIALSIVITRSITLPLSRMKKKTGEVAGGILKADLDLDLAAPPEIATLAAAFNSMCMKLGEVDRMKSDFYSLMSHELRTPLTSIREGTNLFLEGLGGDVTEKQRELLVIIAEESSRLIELVSSLLELSRLEAGVLTCAFLPADLPGLVMRAVREIAPLAEAKNITIESHIGEMPAVSMDPERILQVLRNLLGNALKFTPPGGTVQVAVSRRGDEIRLSVTDTGPGIPEQELGTIFDKYRQASTTRTHGFQGTGLGLAIVRHIVEAHGGKVWAESEIKRGSTFTCALPA
ncbi:ATP-binding protein [Geobacter sp. SVR]|uniref:sensor histidine kinase n=1 Tax=Geobacter sp. SVR TaxID=2495594 RepID=UPI00143EFE18|nr:ATP-binding protein [Geobacter sp. SVR]BCS52611.1 hypothetical protein GSVR_09190 [Geobacter sp. SVR]GCF83951.1 hypothetical protein GSbR_05510 [Geobacter sp. SVR]